MALAQCSACERKHERPVNTKCKYLNRAVEICVELGVSTDEWRLHLPDLDEEKGSESGEATFLGGNTTRSSPSAKGSEFVMSPSDVSALLRDNAECKRMILETQRQVAQLSRQMTNLTMTQQVQAGSGENPPVSSSAPVTSVATKPIFTSASISTSTVVSAGNTLSSWNSTLPTWSSVHSTTSGGNVETSPSTWDRIRASGGIPPPTMVTS